jgi:hypothetical protein
MLLREDYIRNRLERVSRNIAYIKNIMNLETEDDDLLKNLARLQSEQSELMSHLVKLEGKSRMQDNIHKTKKHSKSTQNKKGEQLSLF